MKIKTLFKPYIIVFILLTSCNSSAQSNTETKTQTDNSEELNENSTDSLVDKTTNQSLGIGHKEIRRILGSDIGEMQFNTKAANDFRSYMANTLLTTSSNRRNEGYGNSDYSAGSGSIQFCANGTFVEVLTGQLSITTEGMDVTSSDASYMPGYWEVALLPNGTHIILMYSTHPRMLEDSANGFLPWIVPKYGEDFVALPSGELYKRMANVTCN